MLLHLRSERQTSKKPWLCSLMVFWLVLGSSAYASVSYTYVDLVGTLTNLEHLAEITPAGEKSDEWT